MLAPFLWVEMLNPATLVATEEQPVGRGRQGWATGTTTKAASRSRRPGWASSSHVLRRAQGLACIRGLGGVYTRPTPLPSRPCRCRLDLVLLCTRHPAPGGTGVAAGRDSGEHSQGTPPQLHGFADPTPSPRLELACSTIKSTSGFNQKDTESNNLVWGTMRAVRDCSLEQALGCFDHKHRIKTNYGSPPGGPVAKPLSQLWGPGFKS